MAAIGNSDGSSRRGAKLAAASGAGRVRAARPDVPPAVELEARQLRVLIAVVETGGMTAAARALGVAQSTVSESLAALERALGAPVVARRAGARGAVLTEVGRVLLPHARAVLAQLERAWQDVARATRESRARLELIANESVSTYLLPRALAVLRERRPGLRCAVTVGTCESVREGLTEGRFDLGLSFEAAPGGARRGRRDRDGGVEATRRVLALVPLVVFARPEHPLAAAAAVHRLELREYAVFASDAAGDFHGLLRRYLAAGAGVPRLEAAGSVEGVKRTVLRDRRALGVLPAYAVAEELGAGTLGALAVRPAPPRVRLEARLGAGGVVSPAAEELVAIIRELVATAAGRRKRQRS